MIKFCGVDNSQFGGKPTNPPAISSLDASSISSYSSAYYQTVAITKDGAVLAAGDNRKGLIFCSLPKQKFTQFTKFDIKDEIGCTYRPISALCGEHYTLYLVSSTSGSNKRSIIFSSDSLNNTNPFFIEIPDSANPVALFGGLYTAAAIDDKGSVVFMPKLTKNYSSIFKETALPDNEEALSVACGTNFINFFVLSSSGRVFPVGSDCNFGEAADFKGAKIIDISAIYEHCLALSEDGRIFGCGSNSKGQQTITNNKGIIRPFFEISPFCKYRITAVYAGSDFSLFQTDSGKILACGNNIRGQLLGKEKSQEPIFIPIETEITKGATFCVAGESSSSVFIGADPLMSPNRRINKKSIKRESTQKVSSEKSLIQKANKEIEDLKAENSRLRKKIQDLEKQKSSDNISKCSFKLLDQDAVNAMSVVETLGRGAQCEVFKVSRPSYNVLKVLLIGSNKSGENTNAFNQMKRLFQEYEILCSLHHPNIVMAFGFCYGDETHPPSILLQFCPSNLNDVVSKMEPFQRVCAIYEISSAMESVHAASLIHRDLKPENILIDEEGHVRLSDFGVSCFDDIESQNQSKTTGIGTLKFMAPELLNENKHYNNKVDVYSFGVVIYFILTGGKMPKISFAEQVTGKKALIPSSINKISKDLINRCWSCSPDDRPSFKEIVEFIKKNKFKLVDDVENDIDHIKKFLSL